MLGGDRATTRSLDEAREDALRSGITGERLSNLVEPMLTLSSVAVEKP